ncbi:MAG TPA: ricin-type beta-trefoil lectin domain protein [Actinokineospora sp.]|nr:ricin-type beta-trefoil lectin domain protein [Actinokineospora sp.]
MTAPAVAASGTFWGQGSGITEWDATRSAEWDAENRAGWAGFSRFDCWRSGMPSTQQIFPNHWTASVWLNCYRPTEPAAGPIVGVGSGKCVDVEGAQTADGTRVQLHTCNGTNAQKWTFNTDGTVTALGKCLDLTDGGIGNGTVVQLYSCNGTGAQQWEKGEGDSLRNPRSGRCLDALDPAAVDGSDIGIWDCHGQPNQRWT